MKKIFLQKIIQHGTPCYIGKLDPRELVKVSSRIEMSMTQDAQRPLNEKRVKEIASYVGNDLGILPNTLTLATKDNRFRIEQAEENSELFYLNFPTTEEEFSNFQEAIDVMDGQHRLYSFLENIRSISDNSKYEIGFTLYLIPTLDQRRKIFISCNEKQEKVSGNLLMWFKEKLNMLSNDEKKFFGLVSKLNNNYPLKGRIIMSAEKVKYGIKAKELIEALKQAKIHELSYGNQLLSDEDIVNAVCIYLTAWENVVGFTFSGVSSKTAGAAIKLAGIRYMLFLMPCIWERAVYLREKFDNEFIVETLSRFISSQGVERSEFFTCEENKMWFRDRTGISAFANQSIIAIKSIGTDDFNPLGF